MKKPTIQVLLNITLIVLLLVGTISTASAQLINRTKLNKTATLNTQTSPANVQLKTTTAASAETEEEDLKKQCGDCKRYKEQKNTEAYNAAGCRATTELCSEVGKSGGGPIIIGSSDTMVAESTSANNRNAEMMYYEQLNNVIISLDGLKKTYRNVTTTIEVFGQNKKLIYSSAKKPVKHYTFNKRNNHLISVKGATQLKTLSANQKNVLMVPVKLKKLKPQKALVKVTVKALHPKTRKMVTVKTYGKNVFLK